LARRKRYGCSRWADCWFRAVARADAPAASVGNTLWYEGALPAGERSKGGRAPGRAAGRERERGRAAAAFPNGRGAHGPPWRRSRAGGRRRSDERNVAGIGELDRVLGGGEASCTGFRSFLLLGRFAGDRSRSTLTKPWSSAHLAGSGRRTPVRQRRGVRPRQEGARRAPRPGGDASRADLAVGPDLGHGARPRLPPESDGAHA